METRGRKRKCFSFEEAKRIAQDECITSVIEYAKWWELNKPARMPKRPDRAYKKVFTTWSDFLNSDNKFPLRKIYLSYKEAKEYVQSMNIPNQKAWFAFCKAKKHPPNIPTRPDLIYRKTGEWFTWKEFLGTDKLQNKIDTLQKFITLVLVIKPKNTPMNIFEFRQISAPLMKIKDMISSEQLYVIKTYKEQKFDWLSYLNSRFGKYYDMENTFIIPNINEVFYTFDNNLEYYQLN